jgi:hypothetical protein
MSVDMCAAADLPSSSSAVKITDSSIGASFSFSFSFSFCFPRVLRFPVTSSVLEGSEVVSATFDVPSTAVALPPPRATKSTEIISASPVSIEYTSSLNLVDLACTAPSISIALSFGSLVALTERDS